MILEEEEDWSVVVKKSWDDGGVGCSRGSRGVGERGRDELEDENADCDGRSIEDDERLVRLSSSSERTSGGCLESVKEKDDARR
jgi:hypothetical protein